MTSVIKHARISDKIRIGSQNDSQPENESMLCHHIGVVKVDFTASCVRSLSGKLLVKRYERSYDLEMSSSSSL